MVSAAEWGSVVETKREKDSKPELKVQESKPNFQRQIQKTKKKKYENKPRFSASSVLELTNFLNSHELEIFSFKT